MKITILLVIFLGTTFQCLFAQTDSEKKLFAILAKYDDYHTRRESNFYKGDSSDIFTSKHTYTVDGCALKYTYDQRMYKVGDDHMKSWSSNIFTLDWKNIGSIIFYTESGILSMYSALSDGNFLIRQSGENVIAGTPYKQMGAQFMNFFFKPGYKDKNGAAKKDAYEAIEFIKIIAKECGNESIPVKEMKRAS